VSRAPPRVRRRSRAPGVIRRTPPRRRVTAGALVAAVLSALVWASTATALAPPSNLSSSPASPSQATAWTWTWGAPADAGVGTTITYTVTLDGVATDMGGTTVFGATLTEGPHSFSVTATESDPAAGTVVTSAPASRDVRVDLTAPTIRGTISPATPNGRNGWYTRATIAWTCADPGGSGVASCPATETLDAARADRDQNTPNNIQSRNLTIRRTATDRVGLQGTGSVGPIRFDALAPTAGQPKQPGVDARIAAEPTYTWSRAGNDTSGVERYEVWVEEAGRAPRILATVPHVDGRSEFSATRTTATPLNPLQRVTWYVRSYDVAGNSRNSTKRSFTVDPTVPPAPAITEGPVGPTRTTAPVFAWTGTAASTFRWDVTAVGVDDTRVVQQGSGAATRAALTALPDGDYVFRVTQVSGVGVVSAEATRNFEVDTLAPAPPVITGRPASTGGAFSWTTEPGATSRWVITAGGLPIGPAADTPTTSASVTGLGAGAYGFSVQQIDAAGNVSAPAGEAFAIATPAAPAAPAARETAVLPRRNAARLYPKAGVTVRTRTPVLRWARGPAGTRLYNVQLFRAAKGPNGRVTAVKKVLSAFPKKRSYTVPRTKLRPGTCYVWRVWPYRGKGFTRTPLGVSNFCVASARVLKAAAARRAADR
jgi:hypothetical protein